MLLLLPPMPPREVRQRLASADVSWPALPTADTGAHTVRAAVPRSEPTPAPAFEQRKFVTVPCASTAFAAKTPPPPRAFPLPSRLMHRLAIAVPQAALAVVKQLTSAADLHTIVTKYAGRDATGQTARKGRLSSI